MSSASDSLIEPAGSERKIYRAPTTGVQRQIWRPGDGEGDPGTDYFDRTGPPLPIESRWRLFQSDIGTITDKNYPPRFVLLDDRAAFELLRSGIAKARLPQNWPHDFGGPGKVRARRPHRGRPAIKDLDAVGDAKFQSTAIGKNDIYFFTGEKDYQPINYVYTPPPPPEPLKRKRKPEKGDPDYNPRAHGHNQYTPRDMLVKHGAPSFSAKEDPPRRKIPKINAFLRNQPEPEYAKDRTLYGGFGDAARASIARDRESTVITGVCRDEHILPGRASSSDSGHAMETCSQPAAPRQSGPRNVVNASLLDAAEMEGDESDEELFPRPGPVAKETTAEVLSQANVPRDMAYLERQAFAQKLAARTIASLQSQEDVTRISHELSQALVKIQQQAHQIDHLNSLLNADQNSDRQLEAKTAPARIEKLEVTIAAQKHEIQALKQALEEESAEEV